MFCPTCGKDNAKGLKFCASCGTNLVAVSQALSGEASGDFFTRIDSGMDQLIARYSERAFRNAPTDALDRQSLSKSWKILGQGMLTSVFDMLLFILMWNIFPIKFFMLLIRTPLQLLSGRGTRKGDTAELEARRVLDLTEPSEQKWLPDAVVSVTEHTTVKLVERASKQRPPEAK